MDELYARTELLMGKEAVERLKSARVIVFGLGGVGGTSAEALVRGGIGALDVVDCDRVSPTNRNRQLLATVSTVGLSKTEAARRRFLDINPDVKLVCHEVFYTEETADQFDFSQYDYILDAVDTVSAKLSLVERAAQAGTPIISAMGAGNKLDPTAFEVADIQKTSVCPLARVMRRELKKRGITHLKVVYSKEEPRSATLDDNGRHAPGSVSFVPPVAGYILAGEVIKDIAGNFIPKAINNSPIP